MIFKFSFPEKKSSSSFSIFHSHLMTIFIHFYRERIIRFHIILHSFVFFSSLTFYLISNHILLSSRITHPFKIYFIQKLNLSISFFFAIEICYNDSSSIHNNNLYSVIFSDEKKSKRIINIEHNWTIDNYHTGWIIYIFT